MLVFERHSMIPHPAAAVLAYSRRPCSFERLLPSWEDVRVLEHAGGMEDGARIVVDTGRMLSRRRLVANVSWNDDLLRVHVQSPHVRWEHVQRVVAHGDASCELIDHLEYGGQAGLRSGLLRARRPRRKFERDFRFRHTRIRLDLDRHERWAAEKRLRVAIAGASGLIGSHLEDYLGTAGHDVIRLVRRPAEGRAEIEWDPASGRLDPASLSGVDVVVNLAGESLSSLWTRGRKEALVASRIDATRTLVQAMRRLDDPPSVLISASAVGAYGSRDGEMLSERSLRGTGFLADLCCEWEAAAEDLTSAGVRVVTPRFGLVMTAAGGALAAMLPPFRAGIGGRIGDGRQWWSWIALDDLLGALEWSMHDDQVNGVVNVVAPEPVTNLDFTQTLAGVLRRPARLQAPRSVLERLGGMPREMLLVSQRVVPRRLHELGYRFAFPNLEKTLRFELGR